MCFCSENVDFLYRGGVHGCWGGVHGCRGGRAWLLGGRAWLPGGACMAAGGACVAARGGAWLLWGGACMVGHVTRTPPPVNRITDRCKNITFAQTTFAGGKYTIFIIKLKIKTDLCSRKKLR